MVKEIDLIKIVEEGNFKVQEPVALKKCTEEGRPMIYSHRLDKYVPLNDGHAKGEMQRYNIGLGPGSWY